MNPRRFRGLCFFALLKVPDEALPLAQEVVTGGGVIGFQKILGFVWFCLLPSASEFSVAGYPPTSRKPD